MPLNTKTTCIRCREYREDDLPGVRALWRDDAEWGDLTPETWRQWYVDIPHGPALIVIGEDDDGRIVAQAAMTPYRVVIDDAIFPAAHLAAPILSRQLQTLTIPNQKHPIVRLLSACIRLATHRGMALIFGMPRQAWLQLVKLAPLVGLPHFPGSTFRCVEIALDEASVTDTDLDVRAIERFGDEYNALWDAARRNLPIVCGVVRNADYLNYRNSGHLCLEMRDADGLLAGYAAVRWDGQLVDMLPRDVAQIGPVIAATHRYLVHEAGEDKTWRMPTFRAMRTPLLAGVLREMGFRQNKFRFAFTCGAIDTALSDRIKPRRWYLTPNG